MSTSLTQSDNFRDGDTPPKTPRAWNWQSLLSIGLAAVLAGRTGRAVTKVLEPGLGYPVALVLGVVAAGAVAGLVAWADSWVIKPEKANGS